MDLKTSKVDKEINYFVLFSVSFFPLLYSFNQFVNVFIQYGASWDSAIFILSYLVLALVCIPEVFKRQTFYSVLFTVLFIIIFLFSIVFHLDGSNYAKSNLLTFFTCVFPFFYLGQAIIDFDDLGKKIHKYSYYVLIATTFWTYTVVFVANYGERTAYMSISYAFLPFTLFFIHYSFCKTSFVKIFSLILAMTNHILWGTRGPIVLCLIFFIIYLLLNQRINFLLSILIVSLLCIVIWTYFFTAIDSAYDFFNEMGLRNGGIIKLYERDDLSDGRNDLNTIMISLIKNNWVVGEGIYSERPYLGTYSHNIIFEFFCDYGIIISALCFLLFVTHIALCFSSISIFSFKFGLLMVSLFLGIGKLLFSGSYLDEHYFFFLLGLIYNPFLCKKDADKSDSSTDETIQISKSNNSCDANLNIQLNK